MAKLKIQKSHTGAAGAEAGATITNDSYVSPTLISGNHIGGTGGDNSQAVPTIRCYYVRDTGGAIDTGYIVFQKGMRKFEVANTSDANVTVATLVNVQSGSLSTANTMSIGATVMNISGANVANIGTGGGGYTNNRQYAYVTWTAANVAGYTATPTVGYFLNGTGLTGSTPIVAVNSATNVTIQVSTQTVSSAQASVSESFQASRITNKFIWDWNNTKYRYWLASAANGSTVLSTQPNWQAASFISVENN